MTAQAKIEKSQNLRKELGKYLLDVSKLVFGGVVIAAIMSQDIHWAYVVVVGAMSVFVLATLGFMLLNSEN
jgi:hypothetical protein